MKDNDHLKGHRKRLREKFLKSPKSLFDYEIIELLLFYSIQRKDTKPIAKDILKEFKSIENAILSAEDIEKIKGVGENTKILFMLLKEIYSRLKFSEIKKEKLNLDSLKKVVDFLKLNIPLDSQEIFGILYLDLELNYIAHEILSYGTIDEVNFHIREIIKKVVLYNASSIILFHTHPEVKDIKPSKNDILATIKIKEFLSIIKTELIDHIIISKYSFFSFKQKNYI